MKRVILIILDSLGIGAAPDSALYGDIDSNTLGHIAQQMGGIHLPNMQKMGLGNIASILGVAQVLNPNASFGKSAFLSKGKDTTTGHWELTGIVLEQAFPTYPQGFPNEIIVALEKITARRYLWNRPASGTQIIAEMGAEHMRTGNPILYTSADSVMQIAAHEEVVSLNELYDICQKARTILHGPYAVGRVIARPFIGQPGNFIRTAHRRDFSLLPPGGNALEKLMQAKIPIVGIGKIYDIFAGQYLTKSIHTDHNADGMAKLLATLKAEKDGLIFCNLVDFDMLYGHRNDVYGYGRAIEEFDAFLPQLLHQLTADDLLLITADHGNDPTTLSTDHSREYVPILMYQAAEKIGRNLQVRKTLADVGATILDWFSLPPVRYGQSMLGGENCAHV